MSTPDARPDTTGLREAIKAALKSHDRRLRAAFDRDRWAGEWNSLPTAIDAMLSHLLAAHPDPTPEPNACEVCGRDYDWTGDTAPGAPCMGCSRYPAARSPEPDAEDSNGERSSSGEPDAGDVGEIHPESYCHRCNGPNISWFTPGAVWDPVMRPNADGAWLWQEIICPLCFVELADSETTWHLIPSKADGERWTGADERAAIIRSAREQGRAEGEAEVREAWIVAARRRDEARRYYVAWMSARMRAAALTRADRDTNGGAS